MKVRELVRLREGLGPEKTAEWFKRAFAEQKLRPEDCSVRDLFEGLIENGTELLRAIGPQKSGRMGLTEAANATDTSAFSNVTGQLVFNKIKEAYNNPEFLWPSLCETMPTTILGAERVAGVGGLGDLFEAVTEGDPYPLLGPSEEYIDLPPVEKRGGIVPLTREIIIADRTGLLTQRAGDLGHYLGINKEKRVIDNAIGATGFNTYKRNGTATNTFLTTGAYINQGANTLTDWTSFETAELLFDAMLDPNTGEPVVLTGPRTALVPSALRATAFRIVRATTVGVVDNRANAGTVRTYGDNPIGEVVNRPNVNVLSSAYVKSRTSSSSTWFYGQPKKAFVYRSLWEIEVLQAPDQSHLQFTQDIWQQWKASESGKPGVLDPRYWVKNT